jgi:hypothetical protein
MGGVGSWLGELSIDCRARQVAKRVDCALSAGEDGGDAKSADWKCVAVAMRWVVSQESADGRSIVGDVRVYYQSGRECCLSYYFIVIAARSRMLRCASVRLLVLSDLALRRLRPGSAN